MNGTITVRFEVGIDTPSEVQRQAKQIMVDALLAHAKSADISDSDRVLLAEMLEEK